MNHPLLYLPSVENTNTWAREHLERFGDLGAVYTTSQTAGRGRRGHTWVNAAGQALYYSCVVQQPLVQPETLPLLSCLVTAKVLHGVYGIDCRIKWPNDLLLNGKKIVGILCEGVPDRGAWILGIGINLAQPQSYFDGAGLPHGASLLTSGVRVCAERDADVLAAGLTEPGFSAVMPRFAREGIGPFLADYRTHCVNLGRHVSYDGGEGTALDVDAEGRLVVCDDATGEQHIFTGEVSVRGIYGAV
ncbi:biotin--[acetyl-CoA-carboxylase] ligase [uncultured Gemmiger sp.]|uniref:biotin--[acetyl-CoA-carboxylase] ligase n=1 Tax=uncultured Gemmiger sp. TaxID=1623490 RepID=UPI0025D95D30|nr:biotin--[acetyl-CoA-carboxylase] ligase [uncultured Gemmiger sp.]